MTVRDRTNHKTYDIYNLVLCVKSRRRSWRGTRRSSWEAVQLPSGEAIVSWTTAAGSSKDTKRWADQGYVLQAEGIEFAHELDVMGDRGPSFWLEQPNG